MAGRMCPRPAIGGIPLGAVQFTTIAGGVRSDPASLISGKPNRTRKIEDPECAKAEHERILEAITAREARIPVRSLLAEQWNAVAPSLIAMMLRHSTSRGAELSIASTYQESTCSGVMGPNRSARCAGDAAASSSGTW